MAISSTLTDLDLRMALVPGMAPHILCRVDSSVFRLYRFTPRPPPLHGVNPDLNDASLAIAQHRGVSLDWASS